ncbi:MAG: hypothetical protein QXZ48_09215 [Zestosphaera sp.]
MTGYGESLSKEEKLKIIKALEEDLEFRYAVAGAIGLLELLKKLDSIEKNTERIISTVEEHSRTLREHSKRLEELTSTVQEHGKRLEELTGVIQEHSKRLEEHSKRLEELTKTIQEHSRRLEEHSKRLEELTKTIQEHSKRLEEHSKRLEELTRTIQEHNKRLEEHSKRLEEHSKRLEELTSVVTGLVERVSALEQIAGALTEASVARYVYEDVAQEISLKGERVLRKVRNARFDGLDIDLLVESDKSVYVVEVKIKPKHVDVSNLLSKLNVVKKHYPEKEVIGVLAGVWVGREIESYAKEKGITTYTY